jgi:uncharacterized protein (TIGR03437 family)
MKTTTNFYLGFGFVLALLGCCDTARAQNNTLAANPQQLTFNTQPGVIPTPQALLITSTQGPIAATVATTSTNNWLTVAPTSGSTPFSLTVSVGATAPLSGTDVGFINISSSGAFLSVPVVLNVSSGGGTSAITATPNSLSFSFAAGSTVPSTQQLSLTSNSASVTSFTATAITSNGGNWLTIAPTSGTLPFGVQVTVNPVALQGAGPFSGVVAINAPGTNGISVPILVTIAGTPTINVNPSTVSLGYQIGTSAPQPFNIAVSSSTGTNVAYTVSAKTTNCGSNWIVLSQQSGVTPGTITAQINTAGLINSAACAGEIDISAPGATNPSIVVPVNILVSSLPLLLGPATGPTFNYQLGSSAIPAAQNVQISSSGSALTFNASAAASSGGPNFLVVSPVVGTTPQALSLALNPAILSSIGPGTYSETVTIASPGAGNGPLTFPVTLVVNSSATLTSTAPALNFNYQTGQALPSSQTFVVGSNGGPLNFQVAANTTSCSGFLSATPANGNTFSQGQVVVSVNTAGITPQACAGNITVTVPNSSTPPLVIPVTLNVSNTPLLSVGQGSINATVTAGSTAATIPVSVTSTNPTVQLQFSATAATSPIGLTWLQVSPNSGNTPSNLLVTLNPNGLAPGAYTGTITVSSSTPNVPAQTINVTLTVATSTVIPTANSLSFTQSLGGPVPASQSVQINGVPSGTTIGVLSTMFNGTGWLSASVTGTNITVTANGSQLQQGTYSGVVTVIIPGATNSPLSIPVTLTVGSAQTLSVSSGTVNFSYQAGSATFPSAQSVQVTTNGASVTFSAVFNANTGGNFVTVSPTSGNTPGTLSLTLNQSVVSALAAGSYSGTVAVTSPSITGTQNITVNLTVTPQTPPVINTITSSATLQSGPISPGELVSLFGAAIAPSAAASGVIFQPTAAGTVPTTLGGVTVTFNNVLAPLLYVSPTQINAVVPYEVAGQINVNVVVKVGTVTSAAFQVLVVNTTPAIFALTGNGNGQGAILNQNLTVNGSGNPAAKGSVIVIYATGEGQIVPVPATGAITSGVAPFPKPVANVSLTVGGQAATPVFVGEAPTLVSGVLQINAIVPTNIGSGNQQIVLTIGNSTNNLQVVTVAVQ